MPPVNYYQKVVIITGGSSGIGLALAKQFARQNAHLVLIARNFEKLANARKLLESIAESKSVVYNISADVSDRGQVEGAIDETAEKFGRIDVVINCAGFINCGRFSDQQTEDIERCLRVNYLGAVYVSKKVWPWLKMSGGQLSFVSSVAGYMGLIGYSSYAPPKFALMGLAECLRMEAERDGIGISIIYPPDTDTAMLEFEKEYSLPESRALSNNIKAVSPDKVAQAYLRGLQRRRFEIYCDRSSYLMRLFKSNFPALFNYFISKIARKAVSKSRAGF